MAEIIVKIGTVAAGDRFYQDGDVISAFNDRMNKQTHAELICWGRDANGNKLSGFLGDTQPLLKMFLSKIYKYRIERVSQNEYKKVNQWDASEEVLTDSTFDGQVRSIINSRQRPVFGVSGKEIWYTGRVNMELAVVDSIWDDIEANTPNLRQNHLYRPRDIEGIKSHLWITTDDFDDTYKQMITSHKERDKNKDLDKFRAKNERSKIVRKSRGSVNWRNLGIANEADILDRNKPIDVIVPKIAADIVTVKPRLFNWSDDERNGVPPTRRRR